MASQQTVTRKSLRAHAIRAVPDYYIHPSLVIDHQPAKGRLLRTSSLIPAGTVLLAESPYAIVPAPKPSSPTILCSNARCCRLVAREAAESCRRCIKEVVWCDKQCRAADSVRHGVECGWLARMADRVRREGDDFEPIWHIVRLLATRFEQRQSHTSGWKYVEACLGNVTSWPDAQVKLWKDWVDYLGDEPAFNLSRDEVVALICKRATNTFGLYPKETGPLYLSGEKVQHGEFYAFGLYPRAAVFNHSCRPNVEHKPDVQGRMVFTAARDIVEGEECFITYLDLASHRQVGPRREYLHESFRFYCSCDRCCQELEEQNVSNIEALPFGCLD